MSKTAVQNKRKQKPKVKVIVVETESPKPLPRRNPEIPPITTHPERLGGAPTIAGTRLPVATLLDYLMEGATVQEFIDDFDAVSLGDVEAPLPEERAIITASPEAFYGLSQDTAQRSIAQI